MTGIDTVKVSQGAKHQLIKLKRVTGIQHWNVLCRWGFCLSLAESGAPPASKLRLDSNVEMSWRVFGGRHADLYLAALKERMCRDDVPINARTISQQFRLHLHRGISYLADGNKVSDIADLVRLTVNSRRPPETSRNAFS